MSYTFYSKITGVSFENRQFYIEKLVKNEELVFVEEPDNSHDPNAIKICNMAGLQLGYLPKGMASNVKWYMSQGHTYEVFVEEITGSNYDNYGVNIRVISYEANEKKLNKKRVNKVKSLESFVSYIDDYSQEELLSEITWLYSNFSKVYGKSVDYNLSAATYFAITLLAVKYIDVLNMDYEAEQLTEVIEYVFHGAPDSEFMSFVKFVVDLKITAVNFDEVNDVYQGIIERYPDLIKSFAFYNNAGVFDQLKYRNYLEQRNLT